MPNDLRDIEMQRLRTMLAEREAVIADQNAKIEKLAHEVQVLRTHLEQLLRSRGRDLSVPEGQGLLFDSPSSDDGERGDETSTASDRPFRSVLVGT